MKNCSLLNPTPRRKYELEAQGSGEQFETASGSVPTRRRAELVFNQSTSQQIKQQCEHCSNPAANHIAPDKTIPQDKTDSRLAPQILQWWRLPKLTEFKRQRQDQHENYQRNELGVGKAKPPSKVKHDWPKHIPGVGREKPNQRAWVSTGSMGSGKQTDRDHDQYNQNCK